MGIAYLGEKGSEEFAAGIGATKSCPVDRFEVCPQLPHHQFADKGTVDMFPGLVQLHSAYLVKGNLRGADWTLKVLQAIAGFASSHEAWHYMDLAA